MEEEKKTAYEIPQKIKLIRQWRVRSPVSSLLSSAPTPPLGSLCPPRATSLRSSAVFPPNILEFFFSHTTQKSDLKTIRASAKRKAGKTCVEVKKSAPSVWFCGGNGVIKAALGYGRLPVMKSIPKNESRIQREGERERRERERRVRERERERESRGIHHARNLSAMINNVAKTHLIFIHGASSFSFYALCAKKNTFFPPVHTALRLLRCWKGQQAGRHDSTAPHSQMKLRETYVSPAF